MENAFDKYRPNVLVPLCAFLTVEETLEIMRRTLDDRVYREKQLALAYKQSREVFEDYKKRLEDLA